MEAMSAILAAVDNSAAARPVLETAKAIEPLYGSPVEAIHVGDGPATLVDAEATAAGLPLRYKSGTPLEILTEMLRRPEVRVLVIGARGTPAGPRPAGGTALELITSVPKPVVVVPPETHEPERIDRILVPLDGSVESAAAVATTIELARGSGIEVIVLHVRPAKAVHAFSDHVQHEAQAWVDEFLARFCPVPPHEVDVELRVGVPHDEVGIVARDTGADLIALGWSQELAPGRAAVVRTALSSSPVPVLLTPLSLPSASSGR
jgi:nucleotide-binding universal stress UspA family protein